MGSVTPGLSNQQMWYQHDKVFGIILACYLPLKGRKGALMTENRDERQLLRDPTHLPSLSPPLGRKLMNLSVSYFPFPASLPSCRYKEI